MNEQFKELAKQSGLNIDGFGDPIWGCLDSADAKTQFLEKFAESIVAECVKSYETEVDTWIEMASKRGAIKRVGVRAIKRPFGIDERSKE